MDQIQKFYFIFKVVEVVGIRNRRLQVGQILKIPDVVLMRFLGLFTVFLIDWILEILIMNIQL